MVTLKTIPKRRMYEVFSVVLSVYGWWVVGDETNWTYPERHERSWSDRWRLSACWRSTHTTYWPLLLYRCRRRFGTTGQWWWSPSGHCRLHSDLECINTISIIWGEERTWGRKKRNLSISVRLLLRHTKMRCRKIGLWDAPAILSLHDNLEVWWNDVLIVCNEAT